MNTILLVDKPAGITSFDVIRILRKELGIRKMGHAGTLDPFATGLLLIGVDRGTKELTKLIGLPKQYVAEIILGKRTSTGDPEGETVEEKPIPELSNVVIEDTLRSMNGDLPLAVPIYSAIKKNGKKLYEYAREGKTVEVPIKIMHIIDSELLENNGKTLIVRFNVKSGTYIRTLGEELGRRLGTVATLGSLRRISIGDYSIEDARKI